MRIDEILTEDELNELNLRRAATAAKKAIGAGAIALGALGAAQGQTVSPDQDASGATSVQTRRITPGQEVDPNINRLTGQPHAEVTPAQKQPGSEMQNLNLDTADKVSKDGQEITVTYRGKDYQGKMVPAGSPTPRGAKMIKVQQGQMGERGIGNYTTYLLPNGTAYIYK